VGSWLTLLLSGWVLVGLLWALGVWETWIYVVCMIPRTPLYLSNVGAGWENRVERGWRCSFFGDLGGVTIDCSGSMEPFTGPSSPFSPDW